MISDYLIIGGGPGGLTALACLIDNNTSPEKITWVDPTWEAGRVGRKYREVPSNTKVSFFLRYVEASPFLSRLAKEAKQPNAYTVLQEMDQDRGCTLGYAADLILFLTKQIHQNTKIVIRNGYITSIEQLEGSVWSAKLQKEFTLPATNPIPVANLAQSDSISAHKIVLAHGSEPIYPLNAALPVLDLDIALTPTQLKRYIEEKEITRMAVIGSSHSAILALKNIIDVSKNVEVIHFYRSQLRFASYQKDWILYDNTGLKGIAADWAREEYPTLSRIKKVKLSGDPIEEVNTYAEHHHTGIQAVYAVGYTKSNAPVILVRGEAVELRFDPLNGKFNIPSLYGCGIAYPEQVTDPAGNVEFAVGFFKFMKFVKRVAQDW